jgi:hypothetical protein
VLLNYIGKFAHIGNPFDRLPTVQPELLCPMPIGNTLRGQTTGKISGLAEEVELEVAG